MTEKTGEELAKVAKVVVSASQVVSGVMASPGNPAPAILGGAEKALQKIRERER